MNPTDETSTGGAGTMQPLSMGHKISEGSVMVMVVKRVGDLDTRIL